MYLRRNPTLNGLEAKLQPIRDTNLDDCLAGPLRHRSVIGELTTACLYLKPPLQIGSRRDVELTVQRDRQAIRRVQNQREVRDTRRQDNRLVKVDVRCRVQGEALSPFEQDPIEAHRRVLITRLQDRKSTRLNS